MIVLFSLSMLTQFFCCSIEYCCLNHRYHLYSGHLRLQLHLLIASQFVKEPCHSFLLLFHQHRSISCKHIYSDSFPLFIPQIELQQGIEYIISKRMINDPFHNAEPCSQVFHMKFLYNIHLFLGLFALHSSFWQHLGMRYHRRGVHQ